MGLFDFVFARGEVDRGAALDRRLQVQNRALVDRGVWTEADYAGFEARQSGNLASDYDAQIRGEFIDGATDAAHDMARAAGELPGRALDAARSAARGVRAGFLGSLGGGVSLLFRIIPWWAWLTLAALAAWKLGLFSKRK